MHTISNRAVSQALVLMMDWHMADLLMAEVIARADAITDQESTDRLFSTPD